METQQNSAASADPWENMSAGGGDYHKFETVGETLVGAITAKRAGTDFNGNPCPEFDMHLDDDTDVTVSAGQAMLKRLVLETNPQVGDRIAISYTHDEKTTKGSAMKCFDVAVKAGDGTVREAAPAAPKVDAASLL